MGLLFDPVVNLANMFIECVPFSRWLGQESYNQTEVAKRVFIDGVSPDSPTDEILDGDAIATLRPNVLIYPDDSVGFQFRWKGSPNCWQGSGTIIAALSRDYDPNKSLDQHWREAAALVEPIISNTNEEPGLLELRNLPGRLGFTDLKVIFAGRTPLEHVVDYGDFYDVVFVIQY